MGERISQPAFDFNPSVRLDVRPDVRPDVSPERTISDAGSLLLREIMHKLKIDRWFGHHLGDAALLPGPEAAWS